MPDVWCNATVRTVARAGRCEGFVDPVLLDSISTALTHHSLPYIYPDRAGILQLLYMTS
jgi:hypothetical protein